MAYIIVRYKQHPVSKLLTPLQKHCLIRVCFDGEAMETVAEYLNISKMAVSRAISRAKVKLTSAGFPTPASLRGSRADTRSIIPSMA